MREVLLWEPSYDAGDAVEVAAKPLLECEVHPVALGRLIVKRYQRADVARPNSEAKVPTNGGSLGDHVRLERVRDDAAAVGDLVVGLLGDGVEERQANPV